MTYVRVVVTKRKSQKTYTPWSIGQKISLVSILVPLLVGILKIGAILMESTSPRTQVIQNNTGSNNPITVGDGNKISIDNSTHLSMPSSINRANISMGMPTRAEWPNKFTFPIRNSGGQPATDFVFDYLFTTYEKNYEVHDRNPVSITLAPGESFPFPIEPKFGKNPIAINHGFFAAKFSYTDKFSKKHFIDRVIYRFVYDGKVFNFIPAVPDDAKDTWQLFNKITNWH